MRDASRDHGQRLAHAEDRNALIAAEVGQTEIAGDDGIGACGKGAGNDVIVIGVALDDARGGQGVTLMTSDRERGRR